MQEQLPETNRRGRVLSDKTKNKEQSDRKARGVQQRQRLDAEAARQRRRKFAIWGSLGALVLAAFAVTVFLSVGSGGSDAASRPYVGGDFHAMAVDPAKPGRVMVGGHGGAAISENGGKAWEQIEDLSGADPMGWAVDSANPQKMYAGGHPGFFRSEDGGESWSLDNSGLPATDVHGLGINPQNPDILYAYIAGAGLYRTPDAGESWEQVNSEVAVMGPILVDPRDSDTLYLAAMEGGFQKSTDGGESWEQVGTVPGGMATWVSQDRVNPDTFYAAGGGQVYKSTDGGGSWQPVGDGLPGGISTVAVAPGNPEVVYAGALDGEAALVFRSEDGGESWKATN
jgi:photosystem II stability/assembly factor-like uncharacterized protein